MTRKAWMPGTLQGWFVLVAQIVTFIALTSAASYNVVTGVAGFRGMPEKVEAQGVIMAKLVVSDSVGNAESREFRDEAFPAFVNEVRCLFQMVAEGETPGYNACVQPEREGETQ